MSDVTTVLRGASQRRGASRHPLVQLTLVRFREFWREPEAVFWVFIFPLLLAAGLGLAFRDRPADVLKIAAATPELAQALGREKLLNVRQLPLDQAEEALRTGRVSLVAAAAAGGSVVYRYDDTNPDGRAARLLADSAIQRAAGRNRPGSSKRSSDSRAGLEIHRLSHSRPAGDEHDGERDVGDRVRDRRRPP